MTTYGFIGAGNMASAIVRGAIAAGIPASTLMVTSARDSAHHLARETGAHVAAHCTDLASACDVLVLAVKPPVVPVVLSEVYDALASHQPVVASLAAGLTVARLEALLPPGTRLVRAMPNVAASVGQSMTALTTGTSATRADLDAVRHLMQAVGRTIELDEKDFSTFIGLAGSSPAFVFTFIEALSRAGVLGGMPKEKAVEIVTQAVLGSAWLVGSESRARAEGRDGQTPAGLTDLVCSPGGTTIAGVVAMERAGFSSAVISAFEATVARDRELGA